MAGFESVFERLQTLTPAITKMRIVLEEVFDDVENERYTHVCGKDGTLKMFLHTGITVRLPMFRFIFFKTGLR
jgi:hypothetical protein